MLEKSDYMLSTNIFDMQFRDKRTNDIAFEYQMSRTAPRCLVDRGAEHGFLKDSYRNKIPACNACTATRGGNHPGCEPQRSCPHPEYSRYYMSEFLLMPCPKPTHKNYVVCGADKCCAKRYQLFKNWTKRKDFSPRAESP